MTVPTNNEDRDATAEQKAWDELARLTSGAGPAANWRWSIPANLDRDSDLILAAGLKALADERDALTARRLPVSGDNAELIAWNRSMAEWEREHGGNENAAQHDACAAALSASQPSEAAPSDTDREALEQATLYGYQAVWDDGKFDADPAKNAWMWERVQIAVKAAVERAARTSRPVQVEVGDDTRKLIADARAQVRGHEGPYSDTIRNLIAALGGGDHAE